MTAKSQPPQKGYSANKETYRPARTQVEMRNPVASLTADSDTALERAFAHGIQGDERAYRAFLEQLAILLKGYFRKRLRDSADEVEDLVQEAVLAVHARRHTFSGEVPLTAWIHAIARYKWVDWLRGRDRHITSTPLDELPEPAYQPMEAWQQWRDALRLLAELPEKQRRAIERVKLQGQSVSEASRSLGMSESAVKTSIHRGIRTMTMRLWGKASG